MRALVATLLAGVLLVPATGSVPASATRVMPGNFTGYAFDTCDAPSQKAMNHWRSASKYWGVGIYIAGMNRACSTQSNLSRRWVATQARKGWAVLPLVVGRQASCAPKGFYVGKRISAKRAGGYAKARRQGGSAATGAVRAARRLGISRGSVIWYDLEHFDITRKRCRRSALSFTSGWTRRLHRLHYRSGFYSSASSGITMVDGARRSSPRRHALPDYLWVAEWNGSDSLRSGYLSKQGWWPDRRVHQYRGGHDERHGGSLINIDSNFMSSGRGTLPGRPTRSCGVRIGFQDYPRLERGDRGRRVRAAQCLLHQRRVYAGRLNGRFTRATQKAVHRYQRTHGLTANGRLNRPTWTTLLSEGSRSLLKVGSGGRGVRRLQRALNAGSRAGLPVDGIFSRAEMQAVRHYQARAGLPRTGVVTDVTWRRLQRGRTVPRMTGSHHLSLFEHLQELTQVPWNSGAPPRS